MSSLIPNRQWDDVRRMSPEQLRGKHCCEVFDGETYLGTWITAVQNDPVIMDSIRIKSDYLGVRCNSVLPREEDVMEPVSELVMKNTLYHARVAQMAKAREAKKLKKVSA